MLEQRGWVRGSQSWWFFLTDGVSKPRYYWIFIRQLLYLCWVVEHPSLLLTVRHHIPSKHYLVPGITFILFLKSLDRKHLPHAKRVSHDFLSLLRSLLSLRACFSCHTFFPGRTENKSRKNKKSILFFQRFGKLSFAFFHRLVEISFAFSISFSFFLLPFRVRVCSRSTATRASPAPSRVSADAGG